MSSRLKSSRTPALLLVVIATLACNAPTGTAGSTPLPPDTAVEVGAAPAAGVTLTTSADTPTAAVVHVKTPGVPGTGKIVYDVESESTSTQQRAPYGDSHAINRLERPFLQDMTYLPDLDILNYAVSSDADWWYVSIELIGSNPNNPIGINYGVELDTNHDGFGDYIVWSHPPYTTTWDTLPVQIYQDKNHDTGGLSAERSDAPLTTDGYETRIFSGGPGDANPDMAWMRFISGTHATIEFAFQKSWAGTVFMLGVIADAGLRDVTKLDYVDRFTEAEAGSPIKDKSFYPLKSLHSVDNVCREAFGFGPTGYEPQLCPRGEPQPGPNRTPSGCQPPGGSCPPGFYWWPDPHCACSITPYP